MSGVLAVFALSASACTGDDPIRGPSGAAPASTSAAPDATTAPDATPVRPEGFRSVAARVTPADGSEPCDLCVWLADRDDLRRRGLMGVTDLGDADAMIFVFDEPRTTAFTMRNTLLPLSIAFFGVDGAFLDAFDMTPCTVEVCDSYPTPEDVAIAIEVPQGTLAEFGIASGSVIEVFDQACAARPDGA